MGVMIPSENSFRLANLKQKKFHLAMMKIATIFQILFFSISINLDWSATLIFTNIPWQYYSEMKSSQFRRQSISTRNSLRLKAR